MNAMNEISGMKTAAGSIPMPALAPALIPEELEAVSVGADGRLGEEEVVGANVEVPYEVALDIGSVDEASPA